MTSVQIYFSSSLFLQRNPPSDAHYVGFIDCMLTGKSLTDIGHLLSPHNFKKKGEEIRHLV